jgi:hypothetical protein
MSFVIASPELMTSAATDLATIGSNVNAAHLAAAAPTVAVIPAAADEVSAGVAHLFSRYAAGFQSLAGQATAFHEQFVQNLTASAHSYAATEAANTGIVNDINSLPLVQSLLQSIQSFQSFRNLVTTLPAPSQNLIYDFFALLGLAIYLGLFILAAPIIIPILPILLLAGAA